MRSASFHDHYEHFRLVMITARKAAGLTQASLGVRLHRPQSFVAKVENGERRLDVVEFAVYADALGVKPMVLLKRVLKYWPQPGQGDSGDGRDSLIER
jgi:transcriptional regulator with XRE-family HTH domain